VDNQVIPCLSPILGKTQLCEAIFSNFEGMILQKHPSGWVVILKKKGAPEQIVIDSTEEVSSLRNAINTAIKRMVHNGDNDYYNGESVADQDQDVSEGPEG
jgi:hypothetical protein